MRTRNPQTLAIEMYKVFKVLAPKIFADIFRSNCCGNYDLHYPPEFSRPLVKSVITGTEIISYLVQRSGNSKRNRKSTCLLLKRPFRLGTYINVSVDCVKNVLSSLDLL